MRRELPVLIALLFAGCSAHQQASVGPVHASAAQRIDLGPPTAEAAGVAAAAGATASSLTAARHDAPAAEEIRLPDGTVGVRVAQQYFHTITACRQPDGTFSTNCPDKVGARP